MTVSQRKRNLFCIAGGAVLLLTLLARVCSVLYSGAATNILYAESVLPDVLTFLRQIFASASFGVGLAFVLTAFSFGAGSAAAAACIHGGVLLLDGIASFLIDAVGGAVSADLLPLAAVLNLGDWLFSGILILIAFFVLRRSVRRQIPAGRGLLGGAVVWLSGRMLLQLFYIFSFLIEVEFQPYGSEIAQMLGEVLQVLFNGGILWLSAVGFHTLFARFFGK